MKLLVEQRPDLIGQPWQFTIVEWDRHFILSEWPALEELQRQIEIHRRLREERGPPITWDWGAP